MSNLICLKRLHKNLESLEQIMAQTELNKTLITLTPTNGSAIQTTKGTHIPKLKYRPTATTHKDQTLQKLSGDWSTSGKTHDCFLMMTMMVVVVVVMMMMITMTADYWRQGTDYRHLCKL